VPWQAKQVLSTLLLEHIVEEPGGEQCQRNCSKDVHGQILSGLLVYRSSRLMKISRKKDVSK
jgi:hypothetical protein